MNTANFKTFCEGTPLIGHHFQFEAKWLLSKGINPQIKDDTFLLAYLYDELMPRDLGSLCLRFGVDGVFKEEHGKDVAKITGQRLIDRNTRDARNTLLLRDVLWDKLTEPEKKVYNMVLLPAIKTLARIELTGVHYSKTRLTDLILELKKRVLDIDIMNDPVIKKFNENSGLEFNINSHIHKGTVIFDLLGYEPLKGQRARTSTDGDSTKAEILRLMLEKRPNETLKKLLDLSSTTGWLEVYSKFEDHCEECEHPHVKDGRVYSSLSPVARTTRIISAHPNILNLPKHNGGEFTRKIFTPTTEEKGCLLEADYSQIELRILAGISGDEPLIEDFKAGRDPHAMMAKDAFEIKDIRDVTPELRFKGKTLNFLLPFGGGVSSIAFKTGREYGEAKIWYERYWKKHPQLKKFLTNIPETGIVKSVAGMKRYCGQWTEGKNFQTQNPALIVLLIALNRIVEDAIRWEAPIVLPVHDSMVFDVHDKTKTKGLIRKIQERVNFEAGEIFPEVDIPLVVDFKIGDSWGELIDYKGD